MSINPVPNIEPAGAAQFADAYPQKRPPAPAEGSSARSDPGTPPKQDAVFAPTTSASTEVAQDEVQVQRNAETNGEIVIRYLDHSGNLILQVPSSEMLGITRAIDQDFQASAKARETEAATLKSDAGGNHGN
ncbi:MAG TPA: hypothetical protein VMD99_07195 [Terriglobales bacterium]|nr:hypothetical protein [Terriglobales bacterium]